MDLINMCRIAYPGTKEYTFNSAAHGSFPKIGYRLDHETILNKYSNGDHHRKPKLDTIQKSMDRGDHNHSGNTCSKATASMAQEMWTEIRLKDCKSHRWWIATRKLFSEQGMVDVHMNLRNL